MIANSPEHGQAVPSLSHRTTRLWRFFTIMLLTCAMLFAGRMVPAGPAHMAMADDETDTATQTTALSITESTPVVTDTSGYHITISISNPTYAATSPGLVTVAYNPSYAFVSRTDIQHWATGDVSIPVRTVLGTATVPSIAANKKVSVKIDAAADSDALKALQMWGPKPLLVTYQATQATDSQSTDSSDGSSGSDRIVDPNAKPIRLHSFLTRSSQGLRNAQTPPMAITMVMPLMNTDQQADKNAIDSWWCMTTAMDPTQNLHNQVAAARMAAQTTTPKTPRRRNHQCSPRTTMMHSPPNSPSSASTAICRP